MLRYSVVNTSSIIKRLRLFNYCSQNIQGTTPNRNLTKTCFPKIDRNTIEHLERLSLVDFGDERGIKIVEAAIKFADQLNEIDISGVEPFITVLENEPLFLRDDTVTSEISRSELLSHSQMVIEDYYIAPVGNVAFIPKEKKYYNQENEIEKVETKSQ